MLREAWSQVVSRLDQLSGLKFDIMLFTSVFASLFTRNTWPKECGDERP